MNKGGRIAIYINNLLHNIFCRGFLGRLVAIGSKMHRKVSPLGIRPYLELTSPFRLSVQSEPLFTLRLG